MKKKLYSLIIAIVVLVLLFLVYIFASGNSADETEENADESISMEDLGTQITSLSNIDSFTVKNSNGNFVFNKDGDTWTIEGYNSTFNSSVLNTMSRVFTSLYAESIIEEDAQDMAKYSLDNPAVVASSEDITINVGSLTADNKYYYVSLNDDNTIYMVNSARLNCLEYGLNDMVDKTLPKIDSDTIQELSISYQDDKDNILIKYDSDNPLAREYAENNGLATLIMEEPIENMLVYPYNLQGSVLINLDSLNITDLVDIDPSDLSVYGLDTPVCSIYIADMDNSISVKTGNFVPDTDNGYVYVMVNDRPEVFTMTYNAIRPFENASVADFVEKFISLYQRSKVDKIIIEGDETYTVDFKAEGENDYREVDEGVTQDFRNTYINGTLVDRSTFTDFYELVVGISFDDILTDYEIQGDPEVTITFELSDGSTDTSNYYNYDSSFYVVNKSVNDTGALLVSKQTVRKVLSEAENLSE